MIEKWSMVVRFRNGMNDNSLDSVSVATDAIAKDDSGNYVLRLKDNQNLQPGKETNYISVMEKSLSYQIAINKEQDIIFS